MTGLISALDKVKKEDDGRHVMSVMAPDQGDYKVTWDPENEDEVKAAQKSFDDLRKKGMACYSVTKKGAKGRVLTKFDPDAEAMIMAPALVGG
jgi:hypothetical protein